MRKISIIISMILVLSFFILGCGAKTEHKWGYVTVAKLFFRDQPSLNGKQLGSLNLAEKVLILEEGKKNEEIGGKSGVWVRIESGDKKGWVFGAFISNEPVAAQNELAQKMSGLYYYVQPKNPRMINRILEIKETNYTEKVFSSNLGLTDKYTGKIVYQADSLYLDANSRLVRPSAYIVYPETAEERSAYANAYSSFSEEERHLVKLKKQAPQAGSQKLFILACESKIYLVNKADTNCTNLDWAYEKK